MQTATVVFDMHGIIYEHAKSAESGDYVAIESGLALLLSYYQLGYKIVILSSSSTEHSRAVLEHLLLNHSHLNQRQFFKDIDILSMKYFGNKDDADSWQRALEPYKNIEHIYEDGEYKLQMAGLASRQLGYQPQLHLSAK